MEMLMQPALSGSAVCSSEKPKDTHYQRTWQEHGKIQRKKCDQIEYPNAESYALFVFIFCHNTLHLNKITEVLPEDRDFPLLFILPKIRVLLKEQCRFRDFLTSLFHQFKCTLNMFAGLQTNKPTGFHEIILFLLRGKEGISLVKSGKREISAKITTMYFRETLC